MLKERSVSTLLSLKPTLRDICGEQKKRFNCSLAILNKYFAFCITSSEHPFFFCFFFVCETRRMRYKSIIFNDISHWTFMIDLGAYMRYYMRCGDVTVNETVVGSISTWGNLLIDIDYKFMSAESGERSVLTLHSLCLSCYMRDIVI